MNAATKAARERGERAKTAAFTYFTAPTDVGRIVYTHTSHDVCEALQRVIARCSSARVFDEWFCVYLDSLDGTDAKTFSANYMAAFRDDIWVGHLDWPAKDPDYDWEHFDEVSKLKEWERVARNCSDLLLAAQKMNLPNTATVVARIIGEIVAFRLECRDFGAPRIVSEGLLNLMDGKPYKTGSKRGILSEVSAAYFTFVMTGTLDPSQAEVGAYLAGKGIAMSRSRLSKAFDTLRLKSKAGDARCALSDAGKRRRGRT